MIFAELQCSKPYEDVHLELEAFLAQRFARIEAGLQGDSWIWIFDGEEKVAIDTFTSMKHQVKSARPGAHVQAVLDALRTRFKVNVYDRPELEGHEDG